MMVRHGDGGDDNDGGDNGAHTHSHTLTHTHSQTHTTLSRSGSSGSSVRLVDRAESGELVGRTINNRRDDYSDSMYDGQLTRGLFGRSVGPSARREAEGRKSEKDEMMKSSSGGF